MLQLVSMILPNSIKLYIYICSNEMKILEYIINITTY